MKPFKINKKAVSTVIATIIIVAISIVMAIAVAYWALGVGGSFTRFEKIAFTSAYVDANGDVAITLKNTGTAAATIDTDTGAFVNGVPGNLITLDGEATMQPGEMREGTITLPDTIQSGATVEVMIQTTAGNQYPKVVVVP